ncbi:MAG: PilT/PilU family type 4a pilus ATPase [Candidatus Pacebacteria bacterium]|nr:PilT/PilU family type 4a pilus ATPase [Candidatus Paceibacterota bacterium]
MLSIRELFKIAVERNASDLHLVVGLTPILRISGQLVDINKGPIRKTTTSSLDIQTDEASNTLLFPVVKNKDIEDIIKDVLTKGQQEKFYENKDLDFSLSLEEGRFRGNLSFEKGNLKLVARIINFKCPSLEEINMPEITKELLNSNQGLILVTGPTGSGKSTTLAAMINYINKTRAANIVTLEDPIEFIFKPEKSIITQRQLGTDMVSFPSGLKHILRQDPDIIMVGEMRDLETISTAITLAETGHLILATLHTYSAVQTIDRIIDIFPPYQQSQVKSQLSLILKAVISQKLLPKLGGGRVAAREVMIRNDAVSNLIREHKIAQIKNVIETNYQNGMVSFPRAIKDLYSQDLITEEVAQAQMEDPGVLV